MHTIQPSAGITETLKEWCRGLSPRNRCATGKEWATFKQTFRSGFETELSTSFGSCIHHQLCPSRTCHVLMCKQQGKLLRPKQQPELPRHRQFWRNKKLRQELCKLPSCLKQYMLPMPLRLRPRFRLLRRQHMLRMLCKQHKLLKRRQPPKRLGKMQGVCLRQTQTLQLLTMQCD